MKKQEALDLLEDLKYILDHCTIPAEIDMKLEFHLIYQSFEELNVKEKLIIMVAPTKEKAEQYVEDMKRILCDRQSKYEIKSFKFDNVYSERIKH